MKVNITQLMTAIQEAPPFVFPEMNEGTNYLFTSLYCRLASDEVVWLSSLDLNAFSLEDVVSLGELYGNVFEQTNYKVHSIANALRKITPVCKAAAYI
jgi:hypothetical protein